MRFYCRDKNRLPGLLLGVVDGGSLERRVMRLIDTRLPWARRWRVVSAVGCVVVLGAASMGVGMLGVRPSAAQGAEGATKLPVFEVVSVKPLKEARGMMHVQFTADGFSTSSPLGIVIWTAYGVVRGEQISGVPEWAHSDRYAIEAKVADSEVAGFQKLSMEQKNRMVQALLEDRFKLKVHREMKEAPMYALVVAKSGTKLKEATANETYPNGMKGPDGKPMGGGHVLWMGTGHLIGQGASMDGLVEMLAGDLSRMVVNKTGLTGQYDFTLHFATDQDGGTASDDSLPSVFTALEEIGLRLEPIKDQEEFVVVDHIERPSEN